jgi:nickel transport protein
MNRISLFFLVITFMAAPAYAHKVNMFAFVEGDRVVVQGYFSDGHKALNSRVQVFAPGGEKLVEGTTDKDGTFSFKVPQISDLRITLYAGMGHRTEYTLPQAELAGVRLGGAAAGPTKDAAAAPVADEAAAPADTDAGAEASGGASVAPSELEGMVRKAVSESMLPVVRELSELKEARSFSDIVGGIGFIVGIIGIFFYVKARKEFSKPNTNTALGPQV